MIICADYHPSTCTSECLYARNTKKHMYNSRDIPYIKYSTASKLYGTKACMLYWKQDHLFKNPNKLDEIRKYISKAVDEAFSKILDAADISPQYYESHSEEFKLQETRSSSLSMDIGQYELYHKGHLIGIYIVHTSVSDLGTDIDPSIDVEIKYFPTEKPKLIFKGE